MPTINIPKANIRPPGRTADNPIGPFDVPAGASSFVLSVPLSQAIDPANSLDVGIERSTDGGVAWERFSGFGVDGGYDGSDSLGCSTSFWNGIGQPDGSFPDIQVRMVILVAGANLSVANGGTLVVT